MTLINLMLKNGVARYSRKLLRLTQGYISSVSKAVNLIPVIPWNQLCPFNTWNSHDSPGIIVLWWFQSHAASSGAVTEILPSVHCWGLSPSIKLKKIPPPSDKLAFTEKGWNDVQSAVTVKLPSALALWKSVRENSMLPSSSSIGWATEPNSSPTVDPRFTL